MRASPAAPRVQVPDRFNIVSVLIDDKIALGRGDRVAVYYEDQRITYRDLHAMTNRVGNTLLDLGVQMENRVMLLMYDSPELIASFLGAMKIGAVPFPVNTMARAQDYEYVLNNSRAVCCIASASLAPAIEEVRGKLKYLKHLIVVGDPGIGQLSLADLMDAASPELAAEEMSKDDAAFWLYSMGTTGSPKAAVHLHHDIVFACEYYAKPILGINENDVVFSIAKLFFAYGLGNSLYFPLYVGASTVLISDRPDAAQTFALIQRFRPTLFFGIPTMYAALLAVPAAETSYDTSSLRLCISAGEVLPKAMVEQWLSRFGVEILDGIGSTETAHIFISNRPGQVRPGSTGLVVPGYQVKLMDERGRPITQGEVGNLLVKGDSNCAFYWNKHEKTKENIQGEWIRTGDRYYQDEDGYFWYAGRSDDMLKVSGQWMSPIEVEHALMQHPAVLECAVIGVTDQDGLVKPVAFVVLQNGVQGTSDLQHELRQFVKSKIAGFKYPRQIIFVSELPRSSTGKVQRFKLRQRVQARY